jgi:hypothetical protein
MEEREVKSVESIWRTVGRLKRKNAELEAAIPRWINVEDEPPPEGTSVWAAHNETMYSEMMTWQQDGGWEWCSGHKIQVPEPTHWCIPAPPVEDNDA